MLAGGAVGHAVVEFDVGVLVGRNVELADGEALGLLRAGALNLGVLGDVLGEGAQGTLGAESPLGQGIALAELVGASETAGLEAGVGSANAGADGNATPVPAGLLGIGAFIVGVERSGEAVPRVSPERSASAEAKAKRAEGLVVVREEGRNGRRGRDSQPQPAERQDLQ